MRNLAFEHRRFSFPIKNRSTSARAMTRPEHLDAERVTHASGVRSTAEVEAVPLVFVEESVQLRDLESGDARMLFAIRPGRCVVARTDRKAGPVTEQCLSARRF